MKLLRIFTKTEEMGEEPLAIPLPVKQDSTSQFLKVLEEAGELKTDIDKIVEAEAPKSEPRQMIGKPKAAKQTKAPRAKIAWPARAKVIKTAKVGMVLTAVLVVGAMVVNHFTAPEAKLFDPAAKPFKPAAESAAKTTGTDNATKASKKVILGNSLGTKANPDSGISHRTALNPQVKPSNKTTNPTGTKSGSGRKSYSAPPGGYTPAPTTTKHSGSTNSDPAPAPKDPPAQTYDTTDSTPNSSSQTSTKKADEEYAGTDNRAPSSNEADGSGVNQDTPVADF